MPKQQNLLDLQFDMDRLNNEMGLKHLLGTKLARERKLAMVATYDFAVQGGAVGVVNLVDCNGLPATLPKGAIITSCIIDVITPPTSGGSATIALGSGQAANDLKAATAIASYSGLVAGVPVGSAATAIKLTADSSNMTATIATAALTAGKINVCIEYFVSI